MYTYFFLIAIHTMQGWNIVRIPPPPPPPPHFLQKGEGNVSLQPNFQKGGAWQDLKFKTGIAGKEGVTFFT